MDVSRGTSSQFEQPASCGWGIERHESDKSGANLAVETEIFMFYALVILARFNTLLSDAEAPGTATFWISAQPVSCG